MQLITNNSFDINCFYQFGDKMELYSRKYRYFTKLYFLAKMSYQIKMNKLNLINN